MTKIMIDRDLLERLLYSNSPARFDATEYNAARAELFAILTQPTQQVQCEFHGNDAERQGQEAASHE